MEASLFVKFSHEIGLRLSAQPVFTILCVYIRSKWLRWFSLPLFCLY